VQVCFINSKGFGGNNASAVVLGPQPVERMLRRRYGEERFADYQRRREHTREVAAAYEQRAMFGELDVIYNFGNDMIDDSQIRITPEQISIPGFTQPLVFRKDERFGDMLD
jgi:acetoacetyl-[acyl-carrier protein] synthase